MSGALKTALFAKMIFEPFVGLTVDIIGLTVDVEGLIVDVEGLTVEVEGLTVEVEGLTVDDAVVIVAVLHGSAAILSTWIGPN